MKSNYKQLGNYIQEVNIRNTNLNDIKLLGVSIQKIFISSIANIIGTDMSTYKVVKKNQFAYGPVTSRNGDKISIALLEDYEEAIISQAYTSFEVIDEDILLPEYLMMWFRRQEFDRYARFMSHGSAREIFTWEEMCQTTLPIPSLDKQKEIIKEYNALIDRMKLNNRLIERLEQTAETIYKQWFIDFEFPGEKGRPYKSNGGEMEYNENLGIDVPLGWEARKVGDLCKCNSMTLSPKDVFESISYLDTSNITNSEIGEVQIFNYKIDEIPTRAKRKVKNNDIIFSTVRPNLRHFGILKNISKNMIVSTGFAVLNITYPDLCSELLYLTITKDENLQNLQAKAEMSVSTYPSIKPEDVLNIDFIMPPQEILKKAQLTLEPLFNFVHNLQKEKKIVMTLHEVLLSKLASLED